MKKFEREKAELQEEIESFELTLAGLKEKRKEVPKHIPFGELPTDQQFKALAPRKKQLVDTIKMVAYRAETALAQLLKPFLSRQDEARALLRQVFTSEADLIPNEAEKTLTVRLHGLTNPVSNKALQGLCDELNLTETIYPGTNLRIIYDLVSNQIP